jgi:Fur family ferric uptake transcriptional regulator
MSLAAHQPQEVEEACGILRAAGLRITKPRRALLATLIRNQTPLSFQAIHATTRGHCDPATAFRAMRTFEELGLVQISYSSVGVQLFRLTSSPEHIDVLRPGRKGVRLDQVPVSPECAAAIRKVEDHLRALGYRDISHVIQFFADR